MTLLALLAAAARRSTQAQRVIGLTVALFLLPALADVLSAPSRPYGYLAPDAFYYFTIAVNWVELGTPSFDQVHPTNGFHPLWQWLVALLYALLQSLGFSRLALVPVALVFCLLLTSAAIVLLGLARERAGRISPLFLLLPLGAWPLMISPVWWGSRAFAPSSEPTPLFGTLWSFSNGMESALLLLTFAGVVWSYVKRPVDSVPRALVLGLMLGAMSLARLDHAIFALVIAALPLVHYVLTRDRPSAVLGACTLLAWLLVIGAYLVYNRASVGTFMPVSGAVKSTFPHAGYGNVAWLLSLGTLPSRHVMYGLGRIGSIAFPALIALLYFPFVLRPGRTSGRVLELRQGHGRFSELMLLTATGMLLLAAYDVLFVVVWHIGEWYAPISVVFVSLFALQLAERVGQRWHPFRGRWSAWAGVCALVGVELASFWKLQRLLPWGEAYAIFCLHESARVIARYGSQPPRLLSRDDGVVAFGTGFPTTSGTLLALDPAAAAASNAGRFQELLQQRGVDRITSLHYHDTSGFLPGERSPRVQAYAAGVLQGRPSRQFEVEYVSGAFGILRAVQASDARVRQRGAQPKEFQAGGNAVSR
jgi:hypothetical protein